MSVSCGQGSGSERLTTAPSHHAHEVPLIGTLVLDRKEKSNASEISVRILHL